MKKLLVLAFGAMMILSLSACSSQESTTTETSAPATTEASVEASAPATAESTDVTVMSYDEYMAAELDSEVTIETYVQAKQSWWEDTATVYTQSPEGAYFVYNMQHITY